MSPLDHCQRETSMPLIAGAACATGVDGAVTRRPALRATTSTARGRRADIGQQDTACRGGSGADLVAHPSREPRDEGRERIGAATPILGLVLADDRRLRDR